MTRRHFPVLFTLFFLILCLHKPSKHECSSYNKRQVKDNAYDFDTERNDNRENELLNKLENLLESDDENQQSDKEIQSGRPAFKRPPGSDNLQYIPTTTDAASSRLSPSQQQVANELKKEPAKHVTENTSNSWTVFFILCVLACCILLIHILIETKFHFLPESVAIVFLGAIIGLLFKLLSHYKVADWSKEESFTPTMFFFILLPPIIFESGYNLHKGNFFQNIGSILVFAILGTVISAFVMGSGIYLFGKINLTYPLGAKESFAFGSLVSAVDPVATLAIFNALDIDPVLYMLVFGESILNDAVAIVLTNTIMNLSDTTHSFGYVISYLVSQFCLMFFASAAIGSLFGLVSALLFKYIDLRRTPSLETAFMLIFMYSPYVFAEAMHLSGIMAILFAGIVMSHYTHFNLSPVTRITVQQVFRTLAFIAETCVFAYLGLAIFSFKHILKPSLVISAIVMCLTSRACSIFPLSILLNYFREHKITKKMQFIMWFSGLRGAIAFALALNLDIDNEVRHVIVTATLILVLFTTLILGGSAMPIIKLLNAENRRTLASSTSSGSTPKRIFLSKTKELGEAVDLVSLFQDDAANATSGSKNLNDENNTVNIHIVKSGSRLRGFARLDENILKPFFTRKFTDEDLRDGQSYMNKLTKQWFDEVNTDAKVNNEAENGPKVYFKKTNTSESKKTVDNRTYHHLNTSTTSNILLESGEDSEVENDEDEEQIVIDKTRLLGKK